MIEEIPIETHPEKKVNQVGKKFKTGSELRMTVQIGDYDMDYISLDLGFDVNILTDKLWKVWESHTSTSLLSSYDLKIR